MNCTLNNPTKETQVEESERCSRCDYAWVDILTEAELGADEDEFELPVRTPARDFSF